MRRPPKALLLSLHLAVVCLLFTLIWQGAPVRAQVTVTLQQGLNGYSGCEDAQIYASHWHIGSLNGLGVGGADQYNYANSSLLRFKNIDGILGQTTIMSAKLYLYLGAEQSADAHTIYAYRVLQNWDEDYCEDGENGWNNFRSGSSWNGAGLSIASDGTGEDDSADRGTTPLGSIAIDQGLDKWYFMDITDAVRKWQIGEWGEYGIILVGGNAANAIKEFYDSEYEDSALRPKLVIQHNANIPIANAGNDQSISPWNSGSAILLDGSASSDTSGPTSELVFSWKFLVTPMRSALKDSDISPNNIKGSNGADTPYFIPDVGGNYEIKLTVTNSLGYSNTDTVEIELVVPHPRIWLTPELITKLRDRARRQTPRWVALKDRVDAGDPYGNFLGNESIGLVYQVTQDPVYGDRLVNRVMSTINNGSANSDTIMGAAIGFDWAYDRFSEEQKAAIINYMNSAIEANGRRALTDSMMAWHNYNIANMHYIGIAGLATLGDNPKAQEWMINARYDRYENLLLKGFEISGSGGGWPEGTVYGAFSTWRLIQYIEAVRTATGEDLFSSTPWFFDRMSFELLADHPTVAEYYGNYYKKYVSFGDSERNRHSMADYSRAQRLILINRYSDTDMAKQLQWYLSQPPANQMAWHSMIGEEFLWYDPDQPQIQPTTLTHLSEGTGTVFMRSDWNEDAVYVSFQGGDHFNYHQHLDQNSFTIFRGGDLAIESGVYDGSGLSTHDLQYYARSVAHNTMLIYDPGENFGNFRGGYAARNDGGQRMMSPASIVAYNADHWRQYKDRYDTADIERFHHSQDFTYILSDATNAYSSSKVTNFTRQLVYLRPDLVIIYDRVGATNPTFAKKCLVHFLNEPTVNGVETYVSAGEYLYNGDLTTASAEDGKIFIKTLLPENHRIRKVGGRGIKDYWVFGTNYPISGNDYEDEYGEWRIEVEPSVEQNDDIFLNVLYPTDISASSMPGASLINGATFAGTQIENRIVLFSKTEEELIGGQFGISGNGVYDTVICDLAPNANYKVSIDGNLLDILSATSSGLLIFKLPLNGNHSVTVGEGVEPLGRPGKPIHIDN